MKKSIIILALCAFAYVAAQEDQSTDGEERINGVNGWYVPTVDGFTKWIGLKEAQKLIEQIKVSDKVQAVLAPVSFYLYTKSNPTFGRIITPDAKSVNNSHFNPQNPTRFIIHGWNQGFYSSMNTDIRKAWLKHGDFNIIVVDWARARSIDYVSSVVAIPIVGERVAKLIDFLVTNSSMRLDTLHVIGHSLGAHVAGFTGKCVKTGKIQTIVGLDPAFPLFSYNLPNERLNSTDGDYVQTIQTNGGNLGFEQPIGQSAYYPNGGKNQPGCGLDVILAGACSHERSCAYYAEDIRDDTFSVIECNDYQSAINKRCGSSFFSLSMGVRSLVTKIQGIFYVPVNDKKPYGITQS